MYRAHNARIRHPHTRHPADRRSRLERRHGSSGRHFKSPHAGHRTADKGMNFYETKESYILELAVPGFAPADLDIDIEGRRLVIRAESQRASRAGRQYWLRSLPRGNMVRKFRLPARADAEAATAVVSNGLLTLTFPKTAGTGLKVQVAAA